MERQCHPSQAQVMHNREGQSHWQSHLDLHQSSHKEGKLTATQPHRPGYSPRMSDRSCHVSSQTHRDVEDCMGDERNISGMSKSQTDGMVLLQVAKKPQQQADQMGICVAERPREGTKKWGPKGTRLAKTNHSQETKEDVHRLVKNQTPVVWGSRGWWGRGYGVKQSGSQSSSQKPAWPGLKKSGTRDH